MNPPEATPYWHDPISPEFCEPSAVGAQRRLRALAACAWSPEAIQNQTGLPALLVDAITNGTGVVNPGLAETIADAYDELWNRDPPTTTPDEREAAQAAKSRAQRHGWAPPLAWDDDRIDLDEAKPAPTWKPHRMTKRAVDLVEDAEFVRQNGGYRQATMGQIAMRLGVSRDRLAQAHARASRYAARSAAPEAEAEADEC
jgi:hypothetical protein